MAEMDKARNLGRGAIRFSNPNKRPRMNKQSGRHKLFGVFTGAIGGGDLKLSEKSKKGKVRSLSAVGKALSSCKMGCHHVSEKEQVEEAQHEPSNSSSAIATSKRFKVPKNFLNGCNGVHHASVPKKLRSATKKRSRESMLLDSEKVNHKINGIESPKKDGIKKSKKQEIGQNWSKREGVSGPITKDEEEVAETLFALAAMFPDNGMNHSMKLDGESMPENSSVLEDLKDNASAAFEASRPAQNASPYTERSAREATKISSIHETIGQEQLDLPEGAEFLMASHSTTPIVDLQTMAMIARSDNSSKGSSHDPELCLEMGLNMSRQSQISHIERKPEVEFEKAKDVVDCKQEQHMLKDKKQNGLALWPGLSPVASTSQAYVQSSAAKAPDWLEAAICASKQDLMESRSSSGKTSEVVTHKRPWKRCAAHVHISHIIRSLEVPKRRVIENECHQMKAHEGSKRGFLLEAHNLNGMRSRVTSAPGTVQFSTVRNPRESKNGIRQQQCHYGGISQAAPTTLEVYGPQKQNFNFLSLSAGSNNGLKVDSSHDKIGTRLEALSKLQVPYFQSVSQQHGLMSIPTPQSQYSSSSYLDQLPVPGPQVRLQQPQYYSSPSCGTHNNSTVINKQHHQSFWAVQLAAQGRSSVNCNITRTKYPNWQNGRHDYAGSPCAQAILPRSHASLETLGSKVTTISGQQHQLITSIHEKWARPSSPFCI